MADRKSCSTEPEIKANLHDLLASLQAHGLLWALTLIVMLEEDAAMLAFVFS
nr:hypothetical protein [Janthinobacterium sp. Marseille]